MIQKDIIVTKLIYKYKADSRWPACVCMYVRVCQRNVQNAEQAKKRSAKPALAGSTKCSAQTDMV